jgi:hypothetical protein
VVAFGCGGTPAPPEHPIAFDVELTGPDGQPAVPLADGAIAPWMWGPQGGTMILPRVLVPRDALPFDADLVVEIRHTPDPAAPDRFGEAAEFPVLNARSGLWATDDGRLVSDAFYDQLGWSALDGMRVRFAIEVRAPDHSPSRTSAVIELGTEAECAACASP